MDDMICVHRATGISKIAALVTSALVTRGIEAKRLLREPTVSK